MHGDLVIRNGLVVDGSGTAPFRGDVVIDGDRVREIIPAEAGGFPGQGNREIDAAGKAVTPGFIDVHSHSDVTILANPNGESKLRQGITTEVVGNCGFSAFPIYGPAVSEEREANFRVGVETDWQTAEQYFSRLEVAKPAFNLATFVGHGNIRSSVMGYDDRPATEDEMRAMVREVEQAMEAGALGMSTGLIYSPGMFAPRAELVRLQQVAKGRGGMYASHVRGEGDTLLEAADEFMDVVDGAACQGQFSHLKASGPRNWGKVQKVVEQIERANANGADVRFDKYPYVASSTELASLLPRWVRDGGRDKAMERLAEEADRDRIIRESEKINEGKDGWYSVLICEAGAPAYEKYQGWSLGKIGEDLALSGGEVFLEILKASRLSTSICNFTMSQDETDLVLLHPLGMVCTDAACRAPYGVLSHDSPHPRAYGTFGRFFRDYVRERKLLSLEAAVAKVTSLAADTFGLRNRGLLKPGYFADVLVLDPEAYGDRSDFADPHHYCVGLQAVIVNGVLTLDDNEQTGARGGRVLRRNN